jgi:1-aminocyclopropane-1-carboxylate deaminase/D-cysteine desulfhydrase-like pyridoxal-dependent ACC family enzyme
MSAQQAGRITRDDLENKLRELEGGVEETKQSAQSTLVTVGAVVLVLVIAIAFLSGRRKGTKRTTVVEVRRI